MEDEISLKDLIITLWNGKYIIIAVTLLAMIIAALVSLYLVTPLYRTSATLDVSTIDQERNLFNLSKYDNDSFVGFALDELVELPARTDFTVDISQDNSIVKVTTELSDPDLAATVANAIVFAIYSDLEETYRQQLLLQINTLERTITNFEASIAEKFGDLDALIIPEDSQLDKTYTSLKAEQGKLMAELLAVQTLYESLESESDMLMQRAIRSASIPTTPFNIRLLLNIAVAAVLGLMVSIFIVFVKPFFAEIKDELSKTKDNR